CRMARRRSTMSIKASLAVFRLSETGEAQVALQPDLMRLVAISNLTARCQLPVSCQGGAPAIADGRPSSAGRRCRNGADEYIVLAADGDAQLAERHRFLFHELDEHHVHVVEDDLAGRAHVGFRP